MRCAACWEDVNRRAIQSGVQQRQVRRVSGCSIGGSGGAGTRVGNGGRAGGDGVSRYGVAEVGRAGSAGGAGIVFGGGIVPDADIPILKSAGVAEIFTPGTTSQSVVDWVNEHVALNR